MLRPQEAEVPSPDSAGGGTERSEIDMAGEADAHEWGTVTALEQSQTLAWHVKLRVKGSKAWEAWHRGHILSPSWQQAVCSATVAVRLEHAYAGGLHKLLLA